METTMTNSNDTSKPVTRKDHHALADSELDAVTGGTVPGFGRMVDARKGGVIIVYDHEGGVAR
jgi:hypothetical protein